MTARALRLREESLLSMRSWVDRLFGWVMLVQVIGAIVTALLLSPLSYSGAESELHPHVETAVLLGLLIGTPVWVAVRKFPGHRATRYVVACCQMLMGCLLIHVTGGRIETHFHVFVSLAFLAFYLDWSILVPASIIVVVDHYVRGLYFPISVYGVASGAEWRFLEHTGWVLFEDFVLVFACVKGNSLIAELADRQALLETTNERIETEVALRTRELETSRRETLLRLARAAELRDSVTGQHIVRVSLLSKLLAEKLGFDEAGQDRILLASALHDVGKIGMHDDILLKEGTLTDAERRTMQSHAAIGYRLLTQEVHPAFARDADGVNEGCELLETAARIALNHHERWDGAGYPNGLSGEDIPIEARIVAVADVYEALRSDRPYKKKFSLAESLQIMRMGRGTQFDPTVLDALLAHVEEVEGILCFHRDEESYYAVAA